MIELLTVVAVIGVLATLLVSALHSAQRKTRKTVSINNLRQIAIALQAYVDDYAERPVMYQSMVARKYLHRKSLACAEDKSPENNWAGLAAPFHASNRNPTPATSFGPGSELPHSYFKSFDFNKDLWQLIENDPLGGIAACQLHGIGKPDWQHPQAASMNGLVLRALKGGSVVARQVYDPSFLPAIGPASGPASLTGPEPLGLFLDPEPKP